jgi:LmbE family N-acetylglucosaminyl deacetylase
VRTTEILIGKRILFVGAHPDDIEIGCGGTAAKFAARGNQIAFAIATLPNDKKKSRTRRVEATKAAALLDVSESNQTLFFGELPEGELSQRDASLRDWLKSILKQFNPETVFIHRNDDHTDHQAVYKIAIGVFQSKNVFLYYIPRPFPEAAFNPNFAEDISTVIKKKIQMCKCHKSQPTDYIGADTVRTSGHFSYLRSFARILENKKGYSELFIIHALRSVLGGMTQSGSELPSVDYGLRLVRKADGSLEWKS